MLENLKTNACDVPFVKKGWGGESWIVNKPEYCGKLLHMDAGKRMSYHFHKLKDEVFFLQSGEVIVKYGETDDYELAKECVLKPGDSFYVPTGLRHQVIALVESKIFEFSTQHFDEDSIRIIKGD
jgi:mannose-6-phosphate isomerase-like protein (cupin superfamily)